MADPSCSEAPPAPLRLGLKLSGQDTDTATMRAVWRIADDAQFDHLWNLDLLSAIGPEGPDRSIFEGWATLATMAEATRRVRIGCIVSGNTYRHPATLAKLAATVDHFSAGRLEFGIGAGYLEFDHHMFGLDGWGQRVGRLAESLQILTSLWTQPTTTFQGEHYCLHEAISNPKPVQRPHPPVWIGCNGTRMLRLAARHADVWVFAGTPEPGVVGRVSELLDGICRQEGREPATLRRSIQLKWGGGSTAELLERVGTYFGLGFTEQILYIDGSEPVRSASRLADDLAGLRSVAT